MLQKEVADRVSFDEMRSVVALLRFAEQALEAEGRTYEAIAIRHVWTGLSESAAKPVHEARRATQRA